MVNSSGSKKVTRNPKRATRRIGDPAGDNRSTSGSTDDLRKLIETRLQDRIEETLAAALSFGAVTHPDNKDPRKAAALKRAQGRVEDACKAYHETYLAIGILRSRF